MPIQLVMPQLGESVVEGTIAKWLVREGDAVEREQALVEVGTDKADSELPAPASGRIARILVKVGDVVKVGQALCEIESAVGLAEPMNPPPIAPSAGAGDTVRSTERGEAVATAAAASTSSGTSSPDAPTGDAASAAHPTPSATAPSAPPEVAAETAGGTRHEDGLARRPAASPLVRKLALERGIDVSLVEGTGGRGRVTRDDVLQADKQPAMDCSPSNAPASEAPSKAEARLHAPTMAPSLHRPANASAGAAPAADPELIALLNAGMLLPVPGVGFGAYRVPPYRPREGDQVVPFNRRRRLLAHHMAYSKITAPHVVTVAEVDLHRAAKLRDEHKERYKKEGVPLTLLAFVAHATVRALREHPTMNARVLEDAYVLLRDINLGIAVDASDGLIVPNIKRADELSLRGLAKAIDDVAQKARAAKITADDLANSSFSVSNPGLKGNLFGGAIIAQPNVGILRMGKIQKRAVVIEAQGEDVIAVHPVMYLALSYDHRIIDGVLGNSFLYRVAEILEKADFAV